MLGGSQESVLKDLEARSKGVPMIKPLRLIVAKAPDLINFMPSEPV